MGQSSPIRSRYLCDCNAVITPATGVVCVSSCLISGKGNREVSLFFLLLFIPEHDFINLVMIVSEPRNPFPHFASHRMQPGIRAAPDCLPSQVKVSTLGFPGCHFSHPVFNLPRHEILLLSSLSMKDVTIDASCYREGSDFWEPLVIFG